MRRTVLAMRKLGKRSGNMKVQCEYCGAYVEADENMKCPLCNAALGDAVAAAQEAEAQAAEAEAQAEHERELELQEQEAKSSHIDNTIKGISSISTTLAAGATVSQAQSRTHREGHPPAPHDGMGGPGDIHRGPGGMGGPGMSGPGMGGGPDRRR